MKILKRNDVYENFEKRGGSREKGGGGNEIHAPRACALYSKIKLTCVTETIELINETHRKR